MSAETAAAAEQSIRGLDVGVGESAFCQCCSQRLGEGDVVTAYAYRPAGEHTVSVARLFCSECDRQAVEHPTCGCFEWIVGARLGLTADVTTQTHRLTLLAVDVRDASGPEEGETL